MISPLPEEHGMTERRTSTSVGQPVAIPASVDSPTRRIEVDLETATGVVRGLALGTLIWAAVALVFILSR